MRHLVRSVARVFATLWAIASLSCVATPAAAQSLPCGPRAQVLDMLSAAEQTRRAVGQAGEATMETFASDRTGAWTITVSLPDGRMCLLASGQDFQSRDEPFPAAGRRT